LSVYIILRLSIAFLFALLGWAVGAAVSRGVAPAAPIAASYYPLIIALAAIPVGFVIAPYLTILPYRALRKRLNRASASALVMSVLGLVVGLLIAALLALPLSLLPGVWGQVSPLGVALLLGFIGALTMTLRHRDILDALGVFMTREGAGRKADIVLLDTSVIIDGRVADVRRTGFINGTLVVPRFVLDELQHIADSSSVLRRNRGRRGLDILTKMQKDDKIPLEFSEMDRPDIQEVDSKLVKLAQERRCSILTNDYNLNRVAELQGVQVLNINELANAVKTVVLPGEAIELRIIQEGKEPGQGVGYLDDGTMVVIEDGRRHINKMVQVTVTRVLQTVAGRMIFAQIQDAKH